jgi:hypothetical protein
MHEIPRPVALSDNRLIRRLVKLVDELDLDRRDFVIFGSGPLLAHGLRQRILDLDVLARGALWHRASQLGFRATGSINGAPMAAFWGGLIQFSLGWISAFWDIDDLINRAKIIEGLRFAQPTDVLADVGLAQGSPRYPSARPTVASAGTGRCCSGGFVQGGEKQTVIWRNSVRVEVKAGLGSETHLPQ